MVARSLSFKNPTRYGPRFSSTPTTASTRCFPAPPPVDLVPALALPVPTLTICALLGVPYEHHAAFQRNGAIGLDRNSPVEDAQRAMGEISSHVREFVQREIDHPPAQTPSAPKSPSGRRHEDP
jgi:cytochrome P450